jgi:hypothetical protein
MMLHNLSNHTYISICIRTNHLNAWVYRHYFYCWHFKNAVNQSFYIALDYTMIVNDDFERMWKEAITV